MHNFNNRAVEKWKHKTSSLINPKLMKKNFGHKEAFVTMKIAVRILTVILSLSLMCSCQIYEKHVKFEKSNRDYGTRRVDDQKPIKGSKAYGNQGTAVDGHNNSAIVFDQKAIEKIGGIHGISQSYVVIGGRNAYVAVLIDNSATGTYGRGGVNETDNSGTSDGLYNVGNGSPYAPGWKVATGKNNYFTVQDEDHVSHELKQTIAIEIRKMHPQIHRVYVTANRDFLNRMAVFYSKAWRGDSLENEVKEFNAAVQQLFGKDEGLLYDSMNPLFNK
jgi:hypothetical protein